MTEIRNLLIGLEIGEEYSQIAYYDRKMRDAVSLSTRAGKEQPAFPTSLCRLYADREWHFGREAEYFALRGEGERVRDLYKVFSGEQPYTAGGERFEPWELMAVFIREALDLLGVNDILSNISGIMITTPHLERIFALNVNRAMEFLLGKKSGFSVQDRLESFYYYSMCRNIDTIRRPVCLLEMNAFMAQLHILTGSGSRVPVTASVRSVVPLRLRGSDGEKDEELFSYLEANLAGSDFAAVYIVWDGMFADSYPNTARFLTRDGRRAFAGNNLYVKGACFAAREKSEPVRTKNVLFLGRDLVRYNIGLELLVDGERSYYPVISAGRNWYDNSRSFEIIPFDQSGIIFRISGMEDGSESGYRMELSGYEKRPDGAVRLRINADCVSEDECLIEVTDLGFGGLYPSSGRKWRCRLSLRENEGNTSLRSAAGRLCRGKKAEMPFPLASIGQDAASIEEICYFLYHYPELIDGEILNTSLADWFEEELGMKELAQSVRAALYEGNDLMNCILPILRAGGYQAEAASDEYRRQIASLLKDSAKVRMKKKADALAGYGKYISALGAYRTILSNIDEKKEDPSFMASLYYNMGSVYMQMLLYEESLECFKKAYIRFHTRESLKTYLTAAAIARPKSKYEEILKTMHVDDRLRAEIDADIASSLRYDAPEPIEDPDEAVAELIREYKSAAGLPV